MKETRHRAAGTAVKFEEPLHVGRPNIGDRDVFVERVNRILDSHWLTNDGPMVHEFEERVCELQGVRNCISTCNGTVALELAYRAVGLKGKVIVPAFTFVATVHALWWQGLTPVFCDIDPETHLIDPKKIRRLITRETSGIVPVHLWGRPAQTREIREVAEAHGLELIYDAAHAFGVSGPDGRIGNFGRCEVFSFHATKFLNSFEGGMITTNDDELAEKLRYMRNFGFDGYDTVVHPGINGKMPEVCAAMGLTNLESMDDFIGVNRRNYECYREELENIAGISMLSYPQHYKQNFQYVVVMVDRDVFGVSRDRLVEWMHENNVLVRRYFFPGVHRMEPYRSLYPESAERLKMTDHVSSRILVLPTGTSISEKEIRGVCALLDSCPRER